MQNIMSRVKDNGLHKGKRDKRERGLGIFYRSQQQHGGKELRDRNAAILMFLVAAHIELRQYSK